MAAEPPPPPQASGPPSMPSKLSYVETPLDASHDVMRSLIDATRRGNVVAFVGAGLLSCPESHPDFRSLPTWRGLIDLMIDEQEKQPRRPPEFTDETISELRALSSAGDFIPVAQYLEDNLPDSSAFVREKLNPDLDALHPNIQRNLLLLRGIPFRGILTTNYTDIFPDAKSFVDGDDCDVEAFLRSNAQDSAFHDLDVESVKRETMRLEALELLEKWKKGGVSKDELPKVADIEECLRSPHANNAPVIHVHGKKNPVLSRRDYRNLLHKTPAYLPFMRSLFSTCTVLFIGFSMSDEYVKELLSETLAHVSAGKKSIHPHFAVLSNKTRTEVSYLEKHDGIRVFSFDSKGGCKDYSYVDKFLESLYRSTSFPHQLASQLHGKRIMSIESLPLSDPGSFSKMARDLSKLAMAADLFARAGEPGSEALRGLPSIGQFTLPGGGFIQVTELPGGGFIQVTNEMSKFNEDVADGSWHAFVSGFLFKGIGKEPGLIDVLRRIRSEPFGKWAPVVVFASGHNKEENSRIVKRVGCVAYTSKWSELLHALTVALGE